MNQAPRSSEAIGRMFWSIGTKLDESGMNNVSVSIHRYADNRYKDFGKLMPIIGEGFPEAEIQRLELLETNARNNVRNCVTAAREVIPAPLLKVLLENKFDVTVLINSGGGGVSIERMLSRYLEGVTASSGMETIATTEAKSAAHELFSHGKSRLALPGTQFMTHRPSSKITTEMSAARQDVSASQVDDAYRWWIENVTDPNYDLVLSQIATPERARMALLFGREKQPITAERRIDYKGSDAPGFVTEYLDEQIPLHQQLSSRYGVAISPANFFSDGVARFVVLSEVDSILRRGTLAHMNLRVSYQDEKLRIQGSFNNQNDAAMIQGAVTKALQAVSEKYGIDFGTL